MISENATLIKFKKFVEEKQNKMRQLESLIYTKDVERCKEMKWFMNIEKSYYTWQVRGDY